MKKTSDEIYLRVVSSDTYTHVSTVTFEHYFTSMQALKNFVETETEPLSLDIDSCKSEDNTIDEKESKEVKGASNREVEKTIETPKKPRKKRKVAAKEDPGKREKVLSEVRVLTLKIMDAGEENGKNYLSDICEKMTVKLGRFESSLETLTLVEAEQLLEGYRELVLELGIEIEADDE